jgi:excinuclease UvrABC nuclease subunit
MSKGWKEIVAFAPNAEGIYAIWRDDEVLYVGTSLRLRERLNSHPLAAAAMNYGATHVTWMLTRGREERFDMEGYLISKYRPVFNKSVCYRGVHKVMTELHRQAWIDDEEIQSRKSRLKNARVYLAMRAQRKLA